VTAAERPPTPTPTPSRSPGRLAFFGWIGFVMLLFYALAIGGSWLGMYAAAVRLLNLVILAVALIVWLVVAWRRPSWRPTTAIWPAFVAPLVAFALSISFSEHYRIGLDFLAYAVLLTALYLLLVRIMALPYARARIGGAMAAIAIVLGSAYIVWSVQLWIEWWGLLGEFRLPPFRPALLGMTWGSPSVVMTVLVLMTTAAIGGLGIATRARRVTVAALILVLVLAAFISGSRSGWLAIAGTLVVVGALALLDSRGRDLLARARGSRAARLAAIPIAIVLAVAALLLGPAMLTRLGSGDGGRLEIWATALRMFEASPVAGFGPGSWMIRRVAFTEPGELDWYQPHAHSQYFQTAAELGIVGLFAGLVAFGAVAWLLLRALRGDDSERRRWAWASVFGLTYLGLNVFVDTHTIPTVALLLGLPIAVLDATSREGLGLPRSAGRAAWWLRDAALVLLVLACAASLLQLVRTESAAIAHQQAVAAAEAGDWGDALAPALEAARADPEFGVYQLTAALALAAAGEWEQAEAAYRRVIQIDDLPTAWLGLARAQAALDRPRGEVEASLTEALRLGFQQAALVLAAGQVYDEVGAADEADDAYALVLTLAPSLAADAAWQAELGTERFARIVDAAFERAPGQAWDIALTSGDPERARALAADQPDAALKAHIIDAWSGDADALAAVYAAADATPLDATRLSLAARLAAHIGDDEAAMKYRRLIRLGPHYAPITVPVGYGERDPMVDAPLGTGTYYYGTYTYRRAMPVDLLPPGMPGLVIMEMTAPGQTDPQ
jgi:O-antigen ligase/tetratricopeptide (TPR) repeat protein